MSHFQAGHPATPPRHSPAKLNVRCLLDRPHTRTMTTERIDNPRVKFPKPLAQGACKMRCRHTELFRDPRVWLALVGSLWPGRVARLYATIRRVSALRRRVSGVGERVAGAGSARSDAPYGAGLGALGAVACSIGPSCNDQAKSTSYTDKPTLTTTLSRKGYFAR